MFWNKFKQNIVFNLALAFTMILHASLLMIFIRMQSMDNEYLNLSQVRILTSTKKNEIIPVYKEPEIESQVAKKFEKTNTNVLTNNAPVQILNSDDDLSKYVSIKSAPQFVTPIYNLVVYPEFEKENHIEGEVIYEVYLKSNGEIKTINILKATTKAMGDAVLDALWKAKIIPPYGADGKPFACRFRQRLPFRIKVRN